jgi:hypothetical protein
MISCVSSAKRFTQRCTQREVQGLYDLMGAARDLQAR